MRTRELHVRVAGAVILLTGLVAILTLLVLIYFALQAATVYGDDEAFWNPWRILRRTLYIGALLVMCIAGAAMIERKKILVLYLRRFGRSTAAINPNVRGGLGRHIRLVTLQDGRFNPAGPAVRDWWFGSLTPTLVLAAVVAISHYFSHSMLRGFSDDNSPFWIAGLMFQAYCVWILGSFLLLFITHQLLLDWNSTIRVGSSGELPLMAMRVRWMASNWLRLAMLARRSTVVKVADSAWQAAVVTLTNCTHLVVVDISDKSDAVRWELEMLERTNTPYIQIAESGSIRDTGEAVLQYDADDSQSDSAFRKALEAEITRHARVNLPPPECGNSARLIIAVTVRYAVALVLCFVLGYLLAVWTASNLKNLIGP